MALLDESGLKYLWNQLKNKFAAKNHTLYDRYYTESEMNTKLAAKSDTSHNHDSRYYTETETNSLLAGKLTTKVISAATDMNTLTTTGVYHLTGTLTNSPELSHAMVIVNFDIGTPFQIFIHDVSNVFYKRNYTTSSKTWGSWIKISAGTADSATTASKLGTNAGSATQPVYFSDGKPVATTYSLNKTVPADAKFTDTNTWRGVQNNLTSTATDQSLSAAQGKALKALVDGKAPSTVLAVGVDLNTVLTPGFYSCGGGNSIANKPNGVDAIGLIVIHNATGAYYTQILTTSSNANTYRRTCLNGTWSAWTQDKYTDTTYGDATTSAHGLMTAAMVTKLNGIAEGANKYSHPTTAGNKHIPAGGSSGQILRWSADGTAVWGADNNTTYSSFKGATSSAAGGSGLVPAPAAGSQGTQYLRADGSWAVPPNTTYANATQSAAGLQSAADKTKLDGIAVGANNYVHPTTSGNKHIPAGGAEGQILRWKEDGTATWGADKDTTYSNFVGATASASGKAGLVPAPATGATNMFLRGDGTWSTPSAQTSITFVRW